jgi:DNA-binding Lrp family transcriptional regulator
LVFLHCAQYNYVKRPWEDVRMARTRLDEIDRQILSDLQENGRITNVDLAQRAGISAPPCLRRMRALETDGYIRGYHADLDAEKLGFEVTFFALIGLATQAQDRLRAFEDLVRDWPSVRECHMVRGGGDFLLKLFARNTAHENELTQALTSAPDVVRVTTFPVIRTDKALPGVPIEHAPALGSGEPD